MQIILEIYPVAITVLSGVDLITNESARLMLCGYCVAQSLYFAFTSTYFSDFLFFKTDQGWLLEYLYLKVSFVRDYAFQSLVLTVE